jgi:4-amino-4-deoxy-L-arabinose transferase-like glycosyltransferase
MSRIPKAALACAAIAFLNAACWSLVTPPLQVPDEPDHVAYVQELAETGQLPSTNAAAEFSAEERYAMRGLHQGSVRFEPQVHTIASETEQHELLADLDLPASRGGQVNAGVAGGEPPLYYALETIPYRLGSSGTFLGRVQLMRLLSALIAGLTAFFTFLFVREALPGIQCAPLIGALSVALTPLLGFISGGVTPESMLVAVSAATFYVLARGFRRGLTRRLAVATGALIATGLLTKLNFLGLAPGVLLGLFVLAARSARVRGHSMPRLLGIASAITSVPVALYILVSALTGSPALASVSEALQGQHGSSASREISYIWQFYLPKLPGMRTDFPGILTTRQLWFNGFIGLYGWLDTVFPGWVYVAALVPAAIVITLCARTVLTSRRRLRTHLAELMSYATMTIGLMLVVGASSYSSETSSDGGPYWEPRYFLPLIPLLALILALAARGVGRRWERAAGTLIVVMFFAHDLFSQLQVIARYYG